MEPIKAYTSWTDGIYGECFRPEIFRVDPVTEIASVVSFIKDPATGKWGFIPDQETREAAVQWLKDHNFYGRVGRLFHHRPACDRGLEPRWCPIEKRDVMRPYRAWYCYGITDIVNADANDKGRAHISLMLREPITIHYTDGTTREVAGVANTRAEEQLKQWGYTSEDIGATPAE